MDHLKQNLYQKTLIAGTGAPNVSVVAQITQVTDIVLKR
jgi:hypothetical protein